MVYGMTAATDTTWTDDLRTLAQQLLTLADGDPGRAMLALGDLTDNASGSAAVARLSRARRKAAADAVAAAGGNKTALARDLGVPVLRVYRALQSVREPSRRESRPAASRR